MSMAWVPGCRRHNVPEGTKAQFADYCRQWDFSVMGENGGVHDIFVPAYTNVATEGFYVECIETFLLTFGKYPWGCAVGDDPDVEEVIEAYVLWQEACEMKCILMITWTW